jgi:signal transduction histidine kinase
MDSTWLQARLEARDPKAAERALTMCQLIDRTIEEVRSLAVRLRPGVLDRLGLVDALEWFTSDFEKRTGITCIFEHHQVPAIKDKVATAAYRIAQEALTNVVRHAQASCANMVLQGQNGTLTLSVTDNGQGFDDAEPAALEGLGLLGMRERASLAGGQLEINSTPGQGTQVYFQVPLDNSEKDAP